MQAVMQRAVAGHSSGIRQTDPTDSERVTRQLSAEFPALTPSDVERCVSDTWICAQHLGVAVTARLVERIARERLLGVVNSVPPSGR